MTFNVTKDPEEVLDYTIDYTVVLQAATPVDSIVSSSWTISGTGMVIDSDTFTTLVATVWLSGGTKLGYKHKVTNHVVCTSGREYDRTINVKVYNK